MPNIISIITILFLIGACAPAPIIPPTPTITPTEIPCAENCIRINPDRTLQTIADIGSGNFIYQTALTTQTNEPISELNLATLNPRFVRVRMGLEDWEPRNDNDDPNSINADGFVDDGYNHATFLLMQKLQQQGVEITATIWNLPDWMVVDPAAEKSRVIAPPLYAEMIESMIAWIDHARQAYGVEIAYVSINEPALGAYVLVPPTALINIIRAAAPRFAAADIHAQWLIADAHNIQATLGYAQNLLDAEDIRPSLGVLAFHSWDADAPDDALIAIADFAQKNNLDVRCTEGGWKAFYWYTPEQFPSWENALQISRIYSRVIKLTRATVIQYWQMMGNDYAVNDGAQAYPALTALKLMTTHFPAGAIIVESSANTNTIYNLAALVDDRLVMQLINTADNEARIDVVGLPAGSYTLIQFTKAGMTTANVTAAETFSLTLSASSVTYLSQKP
jgi:hypothetical protein